MKGIKKLVALLVCMATVLSLCAVVPAATAFAESDYVGLTDEETMLVEKLEALDIISNDYEPSTLVTKREMAKIIAKYARIPSGTVTATPFDDVAADDEAADVITALYNAGIITGDENGNFHPDDFVTYDESLVFIISAVGHRSFAIRSGGYPTGYHAIAIRYGMLQGLSMQSGGSRAYLIDIYKMLDSALAAADVEQVYYGDGDVRYYMSETETFLSTMYGIGKYRGKVTGNEYTKLTENNTDLSDEQIEIDGVVYDTPGYVYNYLLGYTVDYYLKNNKDGSGNELLYVESTPKYNVATTVDSEDILLTKTTSDRIYFEEGEKESHLDFVSQPDVIYNSQCYKMYGNLKNALPANGHIVALDNNRDGVCEVLFVYECENVVVKGVDHNKEIVIDDITDTTLNLGETYREILVMNAKDKMPVPFASIGAGDVLSIAKSKNSSELIVIYISREYINGKVAGYNSDEGYEINGTFYKTAPEYASQAISVGVMGRFYLDMSGDIVYYEAIADDSYTMAVPAGIQYRPGALNKTVTMRLFDTKGKFADYPLNERIKIDGVSYNLDDDSEFEAALSKICNDGYKEDGQYKIYSAYIIRYTLNSDGKINNIDMGGLGNAENPVSGRLNKFAEGFKQVRVCYDKFLDFREGYSSGQARFTARYTEDSVFFLTPKDGELENFEDYIVRTSLVTNKWFAGSGYTGAKDELTLIQDMTAYCLGENEMRSVDAIIFRGGGSKQGVEVGGETPLKVITATSMALDSDDINSKMLYEGKTALGVIGEEVSYTVTNGTAEETTLIPGSDFMTDDTLIEIGDVVQLGYDAEGNINAVKLIAECHINPDSVNVVPLFKASDAYIAHTLLWNTGKPNYAVADIVARDSKTRTVEFSAGTESGFQVVLPDEASIKIYYAEDNRVVEGRIEDITQGDVAVLRIYTYFKCPDVVIIR